MRIKVLAALLLGMSACGGKPRGDLAQELCPPAQCDAVFDDRPDAGR